MSRLEVKDLKVVYGPVVATHGVTFAVEENEITALIGANGAGKSSTLKAIMGMAALGRGEIWLDGKRIDGKARTCSIAMPWAHGWRRSSPISLAWKSARVSSRAAFPAGNSKCSRSGVR
jgi:ABC-type cobalamin/Fe3+-siderophores transport system ATPase subunit